MEQNRTLTKDELNILAKYIRQFETANKGYLRGVSLNASKEIASIVDEKPRNYNWNCSSCMISLWKRAGNLYNYNTQLQYEKSKRKRKKSDEKV